MNGGTLLALALSNLVLTICVIWLKYCVQDIAEQDAKRSAAKPGKKLHFALFTILGTNVSTFFCTLIALFK